MIFFYKINQSTGQKVSSILNQRFSTCSQSPTKRPFSQLHDTIVSSATTNAWKKAEKEK